MHRIQAADNAIAHAGSRDGKQGRGGDFESAKQEGEFVIERSDPVGDTSKRAGDADGAGQDNAGLDLPLDLALMLVRVVSLTVVVRCLVPSFASLDLSLD